MTTKIQMIKFTHFKDLFNVLVIEIHYAYLEIFVFNLETHLSYKALCLFYLCEEICEEICESVKKSVTGVVESANANNEHRNQLIFWLI